LIAVAALAGACSSSPRPQNPGPGPDGGLSTGRCDDVSVCTPDPYGVCQHTCTPDPGPRLVDCAAAEQNYEFDFAGDPPLWTFEELVAPDESHARGMYSYTDNSATIRSFTTFNNQDPTNPVRPSKTWEPRTATMPRCSDKNNVRDNNQAIHIQGGPFLSWGGGVGIGLKNYPSVVGTVDTPEQLAKDLSAYEGISFWARRGPDSQVGFRVLVGDKYTDDDVAYVMYRNDPTQKRYCERVRECGCLNHRSCVAVHLDRQNGGSGDITNPLVPKECSLPPDQLGDRQALKFCGTPEVMNGTVSTTQGGSSCNTCSETRCDERWPAFPDDKADPAAPAGTDRAFWNKPCSPYTLRSGIFGYWCFDPAAGERPAEPPEQCGDHWTRVVNLTSDWQFYTVPFNQMAQQGWAKRSAGLDLSSVSVVRFTWDGGWVDFWIDQVRFYRRKQVQ
jgi:hypothetical protein